MEKLICLVLLLAILGVSVGTLVKKDCKKSCENMTLKADPELLPLDLLNAMATQNWGVPYKKLGVNTFSIAGKTCIVTRPDKPGAPIWEGTCNNGKNTLWLGYDYGDEPKMATININDGSSYSIYWN
jgi:hypothetical protein